MKPEETIDFNIRWAWHRISRIYNTAGQEDGISMSIGYILLNIDKEGTPSTKLGPKMGMEPTSLTRTLKTMENNNLIYRVPDKLDKRVVRIFLTEQGKAKRKLSRDYVIHFNETVMDAIPQEKLDNFFDFIQELNELLETKEFIQK